MRRYSPSIRSLTGSFAIAALLMGAPIQAQEAGYRWTDADGVTHYTQTPPPAGVPYDKVVSKAAKVSEEAAKAEADKKAAQSTETVASDARRAVCEAARRNVAALSGDLPVRMARPRADGVVAEDDPGELLSDADRAKELRRAQLEVEINCD